MSLKAFLNSWSTLKNRLNNRPNYIALEKYIEYWCSELGLDKSESSSIKKNIKEWIEDKFVVNKLMDLASEFYFCVTTEEGKVHLPKTLNPKILTQHIEDKRKFIERNKMVEVLLLTAFVLVGVGSLLHRLNRNSQQEGQGLGSSLTTRHPTQRNTLVLVIKADQKDLTDSLMKGSNIIEADWQELYTATQFLWLGTALEFSSSDISNYFSENYAVRSSDISEYDVRFIRIDLSREITGFQPDALQIDRRDAFQRLPEISREISISPRLSSEAYSGKGFYNR